MSKGLWLSYSWNTSCKYLVLFNHHMFCHVISIPYTVGEIIVFCHFRKKSPNPVWPIWLFGHYFMLYSSHFVEKLLSRNNSLCISLVRTFHFSCTLLPSCVNIRYNSNVTGGLSYLKILHYKVLQDMLVIFTYNDRH